MIREFISNIEGKKGLAKNNRFQVNMVIPAAIAVNYDSRDLSLLCESTELPGKTLNTADVKVYGPTYKIPYQKQYAEINFNFLCTNNGNERQIFDKWIEYIMPSQTNNMRFPRGTNGLGGEGYLTQIYIEQYNDYSVSEAKGLEDTDNGELLKHIQLIDAFPLGYSAQALNWGDDGFLRLTVQFSYRRFIELK
jgi:hypothetical protein